MDLWTAVGATWETSHLSLRTLQHLEMFAVAFLITLGLGIALGTLFFASLRVRTLGLAALTAVEMVPDVALLLLLIPVVGIGVPPTIAAAVLYSLLPVAGNTSAGLAGVDRGLLETASAIGLSARETLFRVRFPLALPLIAAGVRIAVIFCMGVVTLGGIIGAGGLGTPLLTGITTGNDLLILVTGCWVALLAVSFDGVAAAVARFLSVRYGGAS